MKLPCTRFAIERPPVSSTPFQFPLIVLRVCGVAPPIVAWIVL
jgi:hypothetical protein